MNDEARRRHRLLLSPPITDSLPLDTPRRRELIERQKKVGALLDRLVAFWDAPTEGVPATELEQRCREADETYRAWVSEFTCLFEDSVAESRAQFRMMNELLFNKPPGEA